MRALAAAATGALLVVPTATGAQEPADGSATPPLSPAQASAQLEEVEAALTSPAPGVDPTQELRDLAVALPALEGDERRRARGILARPPAGEPGPDIGFVKWTAQETDSREFHDSPGGQFRVHYVTQGPHEPRTTDSQPNGVPDYVEMVAAMADESETVQNDELDWPDPEHDGDRGDAEVGTPTTGRTDIYLSDLCCNDGVLYGYAGPDDPSAECNQPPFHCFAYLVLDDDYTESQYGYGGDPEIPLSVTVAHEYNHILQFRLDAAQDTWMFESTAVWSEEQTFPEADDWLFYVRGWAKDPFISITKATPRRHYGSGVWNHWLDRGADYGPDVVLDAWRTSRDGHPKDFAVDSYGRAIKENGGRGFSQEFGRFAAATAEWRAPELDFPDRRQYRDVRRQGKLRVGGNAESFKLDHTAYRLLRVRPGSANRLALKVRATRGVRTAIALVARNGAPEHGDVTTRVLFAKRGGAKTVRLRNAQKYERITAAVVNADGRVHGSSRRYLRNDETFRAKLR